MKLSARKVRVQPGCACSMGDVSQDHRDSQSGKLNNCIAGNATGAMGTICGVGYTVRVAGAYLCETAEAPTGCLRPGGNDFATRCDSPVSRRMAADLSLQTIPTVLVLTR
jgi:hypothetical protein